MAEKRIYKLNEINTDEYNAGFAIPVEVVGTNLTKKVTKSFLVERLAHSFAVDPFEKSSIDTSIPSTPSDDHVLSTKNVFDNILGGALTTIMDNEKKLIPLLNKNRSQIILLQSNKISKSEANIITNLEAVASQTGVNLIFTLYNPVTQSSSTVTRSLPVASTTQNGVMTKESYIIINELIDKVNNLFANRFTALGTVNYHSNDITDAILNSIVEQNYNLPAKLNHALKDLDNITWVCNQLALVNPQDLNITSWEKFTGNLSELAPLQEIPLQDPSFLTGDTFNDQELHASLNGITTPSIGDYVYNLDRTTAFIITYIPPTFDNYDVLLDPSFPHWIKWGDTPIEIADTDNLGLVKSSEDNTSNRGKGFVELDGTISTIGWDWLSNLVTSYILSLDTSIPSTPSDDHVLSTKNVFDNILGSPLQSIEVPTTKKIIPAINKLYTMSKEFSGLITNEDLTITEDNLTVKDRNLADVLGISDPILIMKELKDRAKYGYFKGLSIGDYFEIPNFVLEPLANSTYLDVTWDIGTLRCYIASFNRMCGIWGNPSNKYHIEFITREAIRGSSNTWYSSDTKVNPKQILNYTNSPLRYQNEGFAAALNLVYPGFIKPMKIMTPLSEYTEEAILMNCYSPSFFEYRPYDPRIFTYNNTDYSLTEGTNETNLPAVSQYSVNGPSQIERTYPPIPLLYKSQIHISTCVINNTTSQTSPTSSTHIRFIQKQSSPYSLIYIRSFPTTINYNRICKGPGVNNNILFLDFGCTIINGIKYSNANDNDIGIANAYFYIKPILTFNNTDYFLTEGTGGTNLPAVSQYGIGGPSQIILNKKNKIVLDFSNTTLLI
jgi:hypothetical protein